MPNLPIFLLSHCHESNDDVLLGLNPSRQSLSSVEPDELGFALTLFVSAANNQLVTHYSADATSFAECAQFFSRVSQQRGIPSNLLPDPIGSVSSLQSAFLALWNHYDLHEQQRSLCARVLGFYLLMERTAGKALESWVESSPDRPEAVLLHPAVVDALALVPLEFDGALSQTLFLTTLELIAAETLST